MKDVSRTQPAISVSLSAKAADTEVRNCTFGLLQLRHRHRLSHALSRTYNILPGSVCSVYAQSTAYAACSHQGCQVQLSLATESISQVSIPIGQAMLPLGASHSITASMHLDKGPMKLPWGENCPLTGHAAGIKAGCTILSLYSMSFHCASLPRYTSAIPPPKAACDLHIQGMDLIQLTPATSGLSITRQSLGLALRWTNQIWLVQAGLGPSHTAAAAQVASGFTTITQARPPTLRTQGMGSTQLAPALCS